MTAVVPARSAPPPSRGLAPHGPRLAGRCCRGRLRLFCAAAQLLATARQRRLGCARHWPWPEEITDTISRLGTFPDPGRPTTARGRSGTSGMSAMSISSNPDEQQRATDGTVATGALPMRRAGRLRARARTATTNGAAIEADDRTRMAEGRAKVRFEDGPAPGAAAPVALVGGRQVAVVDPADRVGFTRYVGDRAGQVRQGRLGRGQQLRVDRRAPRAAQRGPGRGEGRRAGGPGDRRVRRRALRLRRLGAEQLRRRLRHEPADRPGLPAGAGHHQRPRGAAADPVT